MAFVAGSIMTGTMAFGDDKPKKDPFKAIWKAITGLQTQIDALDSSSDPQSYYVLKSNGITIPNNGGGPGNVVNETVLCDENDIATGGGFSYPTSQGINAFAYSYPHTENDIPVGWTMVVDDWSPDGSTAIVHVVCLDNP